MLTDLRNETNVAWFYFLSILFNSISKQNEQHEYVCVCVRSILYDLEKKTPQNQNETLSLILTKDTKLRCFFLSKSKMI